MTTIFSEDFVDSLPNDPVLAGYRICEAVLDFRRRRLEETGNPAVFNDQHAYLNALALFDIYVETHPLNIKYEGPVLGTDAEKNSKAIIEFFEKLRAKLNALVVKKKLAGFRQTYADKFKPTRTYMFDSREREDIRKTIHELRVLINDLDILKPEDKMRLMNRLGHLHVEVDGKLSDLDRIWGLLGEAYIVRAKYGDSARLIVERLFRIVNVAWGAQARGESIDPRVAQPFPAMN